MAGRELKFFFTSPLFIILELAPVILITILNFAGALKDVIPNSLLPIVWLMIVFYSTYFELELWRKGFLSKGVKLKIYTIGSPYAPFLGHFLISLILLELKTLIFILPFFLSKDPLQIAVFFFATHINWLFSLSIGSIFSKEVFNSMKDSVEVFLCLVIFNAILVMIVNSQTRTENPVSLSLAPYWPTPSLESGGTVSIELPFMAVSFFILILFIVAVYVNSMVVKGLRMDSS